VTKVPRWPIDKFDDVDFELGTAMKSTGEAMAIGRNFEGEPAEVAPLLRVRPRRRLARDRRRDP